MNEPRVVQPRQARSRATMERILVAVEELLAEKPFDQITIAEISTRAASAPTAIYARFSDKTALLLAVHERFRQRNLDRIFESLSERAELSPREFLAFAAGELVRVYRDNHRLLRSVLLADNATMYARARDLGCALFSVIVKRVSPPPERERDLDFAVRTALALLQQRLLFGSQAPTRFDYDDDELITRITRLLVDACGPAVAEAADRPHVAGQNPAPA